MSNINRSSGAASPISEQEQANYYNTIAIEKAQQIGSHHYTLNNYLRFVNEEELVEIIEFANGLVEENMSDREKVTAIYNWITENIDYDNYMLGKYSSMRVLALNPSIAYRYKRAVCGGFAQLSTLMLGAVGIDSIIVHGRISPNVNMEFENNFGLKINYANSNHIWNLVKMEGQWFLFDPSQDTKNVIELETENSINNPSRNRTSFNDLQIYSEHYMAYTLGADCFNFSDQVIVAPQVGFLMKANKWFYFGADGNLYLGEMNQVVNGANIKHYFYDGRSDLFSLDNRASFDLGQMLIGLYSINKDVMHFSREVNKEGVLIDRFSYTGFHKINDRWFYFNQDGTLKIGQLEGSSHYFYDGSPSIYPLDGQETPIMGQLLLGRYAMNGTVKIYSVEENREGELLGEESLTGFEKIDNRYFYFKENHQMYYGWRSSTINGKDIYHFFYDGTTPCIALEGQGSLVIGQMLEGLYSVNGYVRNFSRASGEEGIMQTEGFYQGYAVNNEGGIQYTGIQVFPNGQKIYFEAGSHKENGIREIDGRVYYLQNGVLACDGISF